AGVSLSASVLKATAGKAVNLTATGTVSSWTSSDSIRRFFLLFLSNPIILKEAKPTVASPI
ncbi:MAG: hypothetical protein IJ991_11315, partial [Thermoguttaceae bacterium]|nr:hypothetical protein [Thermoguttaceae bacterium]